MTFRNCVTNGENEGIINKEQAAEAIQTYEQIKLDLLDTMPEASADALAASKAFDLIENNAIHSRRIQLLQAQAWKKIKINLDSHAGSPGKAAEALIAAHDMNAKFPNLEKRTQSIARMAFARMEKVLTTFKRELFGGANKAKVGNMLREIFDEGSTGDVAASQLAKGWKAAHDELRKMANALGMRIANRLNWGLPQLHDVLQIRKAGKQVWLDFINPKKGPSLLDSTKMIDDMTGEPISPGRLILALDEVYESIATEGANKIKDGASRGNSKSLANRRQDHRFLVFKDAESWMLYQNKFGEPDVFKTMVNHVESMSKDIAELDLLGPNPNAMLNAVEQYVMKTARLEDAKGGGKNLTESEQGHILKMKNFYNIHKNNNNQSVNGRLANIYAGTSHILQSAQLGGAPISAITDLQTQRLAARFNGIPQARLLGRILKQLAPLNVKEKGALAVRLGLGADNWINTAISAQRYFGDITGPEVTRRISDFSMRLSGLSPMTQAGRQAFGLEYLGTMADNIKKPFNKLHKDFQASLSRYNISKSDWDIIRTTKLYEQEGSFGKAYYVDFLALENRTDLLPGRAKGIATKLMDAILTETEAAVPSASYRARNFLLGESRAGTVSGSLVRSFSMYKNYSATVFHTHIMRYANMDGSKATKASYFVDYFIGTTLMGALALQMKDMARGKDPRPMDDIAFWGQALFQGGGLGILGDFVSSSTSRFGGGIAETMAGPVIGLAGDTGRLVFGGISDPSSLGKNGINFLSRYTPGSSTWFMRLGLERMIIDRLHQMANPKYRSYFRNKQRNSKKYHGNEYWWKPGKNVPTRPPNLSNVMPGR